MTTQHLTAQEVVQFRRSERARLLALRQATTQEQKAQMIEKIAAGLDSLLPRLRGQKISLYWPIRGELDLRQWMARAHAAGAQIVLPVVLVKNSPLIFREWAPGCRMERGIWNIPIPADGESIVPDVVVAPLVGVDSQCYRLGNCGGYYDRTLAQCGAATNVIGVGHDFCEIPTIHPMPWDIPMDHVILGNGHILRRAPNPDWV